MAISFLPSRLFSFFIRPRQSHNCPNCGRGCVFYARLELETQVEQRFARLPNQVVPQAPRLGDKIWALHAEGAISKAMARRLCRHWSTASVVVHGGECSVDKATQIVRWIAVALHDLEKNPTAGGSEGIVGDWGSRPILGFAGGAL